MEELEYQGYQQQKIELHKWQLRYTFEPKVEKIFHEDSYGYRPNKSAIQAVGVLRERCWKKDWVVDFDIKGLFDNIRHDYLIEMVKRHTNEQWIILYCRKMVKNTI